MATERCCEESEITSFAHFDNDTVIAAVEEISDGEQKQEIESVIDMMSSDDIKHEHEICSNKVRKGLKRHWSHEWKDLYYGSVDTSLNKTTANMLHRKPKKRLFAHRYHCQHVALVGGVNWPLHIFLHGQMPRIEGPGLDAYPLENNRCKYL